MKTKYGLLALVVAFLFTLTVLSVEAIIIYFEDFSSGLNGSTDYILWGGSLPPNLDAKQYAINTDPKNVHTSFSSYGDHTTGTGNMMILNGSTAANDIEWKDNINVTPNQNYKFSFWVSSTYDQSPASLTIKINDASILSNITAPSSPGSWKEISFLWLAGTSVNNANIVIDNRNTQASGNDFAFDDIKFESVPIPSTVWLLGCGVIGLVGLRRKFKDNH